MFLCLWSASYWVNRLNSSSSSCLRRSFVNVIFYFVNFILFFLVFKYLNLPLYQHKVVLSFMQSQPNITGSSSVYAVSLWKHNLKSVSLLSLSNINFNTHTLKDFVFCIRSRNIKSKPI